MKQLFISLIALNCFGAAQFGALVQTNHLVSDSGASDVITCSNAVPAGATLIFVDTYEATVINNVRLSSIPNSSNYTAYLAAGSHDSSVHNQEIWYMYCANGFAVGGTWTLTYSNTSTAFDRLYDICYATGCNPVQPEGLLFHFNFASSNYYSVPVPVANSFVFEADISDGTPQNGSLPVNIVGTNWTMNSLLFDTNGWVPNSTSGLICLLSYTNCGVAGNYPSTTTWTTNGPPGAFNKSIDSNFLVLYPYGSPQAALGQGTWGQAVIGGP